MPKVFAKWNIKASKSTIMEMIEDNGFYIQTYETLDDDNSDTVDCDDTNCTIGPSKVKGCVCVTLVGDSDNTVLSPGYDEEQAEAFDEAGQRTDEAFDFGCHVA
jgi:hypothetical protein